MRVVFRYFGIAASFMTKKTREAWILLYGFLKGISGLTLRAFLCCYVSSIRSFMILRKREGRKGTKMTEAAEKFIPIFVGLLLILRGLFWIVDGKKGNKRSCFFGIAAIMVGIIMFITVFFQVL